MTLIYTRTPSGDSLFSVFSFRETTPFCKWR